MTTAKITKPEAQQPTKALQVEKLLKAAKGASLDDMVLATGWQPHSCRAFLTGLRKKGHIIVRAKRKDGISFYRITKSQPTATPTVTPKPAPKHVLKPTPSEQASEQTDGVNEEKQGQEAA